MSSIGLMGENVGLGPSRRSTRERRQTQHFGHSEPSDEYEELIEASAPRKIMPAIRKQEKRAIRKPSLIVKLPLPTPTIDQALQLSPTSSGRAPDIAIEKHHRDHPGSSSQCTKKRRATNVDEDDESGSFTPPSSREQGSKRQRLQPSASKPKVTSKRKKANVKPMHDDRPEPRGLPEVWAEVRQAMCEALPYYHAYKSAAYSWGTVGGKGGFVYGLLLDNDNDERGYMDEKVVITRTGGGVKMNPNTGHMEQMDNQCSDSARVTIFSNNQKEMVPIVLIVGAKNAHCPTKVPHRYNVLGAFHVTDSWSERVNKTTVCRVRLEMIDLKTPSWWGAKGSLPAQAPKIAERPLVQTCTTCSMSTKQRYAPGWTCANEKCTSFSKINGRAITEPPAFHSAFLNERHKWPRHIKAPFPLKPAPPAALLNNPETSTSPSAWKGMVCPHCGGCNSRSQWDEWKCATTGCEYEISIQHTVRSAKALAPEHAFEAEGHAISFDKYEEPVVRTSLDFHGYWRKATYELFPGNYITHYSANQQINRQPGGADEMLEALQSTKMGMERHALEHSAAEDDIMTRHFGINYGLPYNFVAAPDSKGFSEAPPAILNALNHVTWAGQDAIQDGSFRPFNELLCLAYMEDQSIGYHDDGEKDLGPDIVSISLGGAATMNFKMKSKHWRASGLTCDNYDPERNVRPGSQAWKMRVAVNELYKAGDTEQYERAKEDLIEFLSKDSEKKKTLGSVVLSLELRHGDMVVMHGEEIQRVYDHGVQPKGKLRYGLTGRYIKPENIPEEEHWKGQFAFAQDEVYDGDLALFERDFPEEVEEEE